MATRRYGVRPGRGARVLAAMVTALLVAAGCRNILGIEERVLDTSGTGGGGGGGGGGGPIELSCESYCEAIQSICTGQNLQFASVEACIGLCSTYPKGTLDDESGNSLGCRIHVLETSKAMIESSDCAAAGPGGNGVCGSNCDAFCESMTTVCPAGFESQGDCKELCDTLISCGTYYVDPGVTPDNPSIQCRLYHLSAAAISILDATPGEQTPAQQKHCPHAEGVTECIVVADPQCP